MSKANLCFFAACFFGNSFSLSSSQFSSYGPKLLPQGSDSANARIPVPVPNITNLSFFSKQPITNGRNDVNLTNPSNRPQIPNSSITRSSVSDSLSHVRNKVIDQLQDNDLNKAKIMISGMVEYVKESSVNLNETAADCKLKFNSATAFDDRKQYISQKERRVVSKVIDEAFQEFFDRSFSPVGSRSDKSNRSGRINHMDNKWHRVAMGIELLQLQLASSDILVYPFYNIPKRFLVMALTAVTSLQEQRQYQTNRGHISDKSAFIHSDTAFRLLQRLVTGVGVRNSYRSKHFRSTKGTKGKWSTKENSSRKPNQLYEIDFNRVLNIYSSLGKMNMAHRVIALQERTPHAPALSPVTYSILLKGYGKLCDSDNIDVLIRHAAAATDASETNMKPDTIFFNSLMDAYINCGQLYKAKIILNAMVVNNRSILAAIERKIPELDPKKNKSDFFRFAPHLCPSPNRRSYNILLKGYARKGLLDEALELTKEMKIIGSNEGEERYWWDHVTTNTLVQAAVVAKQYETAKNILFQHTSDEYHIYNEKSRYRRHRRDHPNADAYTTLMDGLCKDGKIHDAMNLLKTMKTYQINPNEYHYSCLIGSLAREKKVFYAENMLAHIKASNSISKKYHKPIYNAFISGLVQSNSKNHRTQVNTDNNDENVDKALLIMKDMIEDKIMPDATTVSIILDGFGHCQRSRMKEAITLVEKLESQRIIPTNHIMVTTALIRVCASFNNLDGAIKCFRRISSPDVAAINALIDASVRTGNRKIAIETFNRYFRDDTSRMDPDVISFSILIGAYMKIGSYEASRSARELYSDMRFKQRIFPDKCLIDIIVKGMVEVSRNCGVQASDVRFVARVLRDAEKLDWGEGELDIRKRQTESLINKYEGNAWHGEDDLDGLRKGHITSEKLDSKNLLRRHGWNEVDSGFRLWGARDSEDIFLKSKGWNDFDSGFRLF